MLRLDIQSDEVSCEEKVTNIELKTSLFEKKDRCFLEVILILVPYHANWPFLGTLAKIDTISGCIVH